MKITTPCVLTASAIALPLATAALLLSPRSSQADATAQPLTVLATVRDFTHTHSDFELGMDIYEVVRSGMVMPRLDADGRPVLNPDYLDRSITTVASAESFAQWYRDVPGVNHHLQVPLNLTFDPDTDIYTFQRDLQSGALYFPIDGRGFNDRHIAADGRDHNFWFTTEIEVDFVYTDPTTRDGSVASFEFLGDDDVFVFVNDQIALEIGGIHGQVSGTLDLDASAATLGLVPGQRYTLKMFHAERQTIASNFKIQTTLNLLPTTPTRLGYD